MASPAPAIFSLSTAATAEGSATQVALAADTSADVVQSVLSDQPFPNHEIRIGHASMETSESKKIILGSTETRVALEGSFRGKLALSVLDTPNAVLEALNLGDGSPIPLQEALASEDGLRYVLLLAGYSADATVAGRHPIGAVGSVGFDATGQRTQQLAVVHRIRTETGAREAIQGTIDSLQLPRQVADASRLAPGTMLIAEARGSIALEVAASLGYNFNFVRELESIGISGDVGLKVDLGLKAMLGFEASGRYLIAVDRPSLDPANRVVRLRLFKLAQRGWNFGLNLSAKVTAKENLGGNVDDFVKAVFGVHGQQLVKELQRLEEWTSPSTDLSKLVAGLSTQEGLRFLEHVTQIDPLAEFGEARNRVVQALRAWTEIPERAASAAWALIGDVLGRPDARTKITEALSAIEGVDGAKREEFLLGLMRESDFAESPIGQFLTGLAGRGILALLDDSELPQIASRVNRLVDEGGLSDTFGRLRRYIDDSLDLRRLTEQSEIQSEEDFSGLNEWLVGRISDLIGEQFQFGKLEEARALINKVVTLRQSVYDKAINTFNRSYDFSLAARWQKTTTQDALLDAEFDLGITNARTLFRSIVTEAKYDDLLTQMVPGVTLYQAVMSHKIERQSSVEVNLPFYRSKELKFKDVIAKAHAEDDGGRVLVYSLAAKDAVTRVNRFNSQLCVSAVLHAPAGSVGRVRRHSKQPQASWSYCYQMARNNMTAAEVEDRLRPFVIAYLPKHFPDGHESSLHKWVRQLDQQVEKITANGDREFGDVLLSAEISLRGDVVAPWIANRQKDDAILAAKRVSRHLQECLRELIPFYYFQDLERLQLNRSTSALLLWSSLRIANKIRVENRKVVDDVGSKDVYWDWLDPRKRDAMVNDPETRERLSHALYTARNRLLADGRDKQAGCFTHDRLTAHIEESRYREDRHFFHGLLYAESKLVEGAHKALEGISALWRNEATLPSLAIQRLANFGAEVTGTFHRDLSSTYGEEFLRPLGSMLFLEAARKLDPALSVESPRALLSLTVLKENIDYTPKDFLRNAVPKTEDIAVQERLVSTASA